MLALLVGLTACESGDLDQLAEDLVSALATDAPTSQATATASAVPAPSPTGNAQRLPFAPPADAEQATVVRVSDGDTIVLRFGSGDEERVRLLRIDTPELARDGQPAECLADAATEQMERLAPRGTAVVILADVEARDQYGRLLAHVWRQDDGMWLNGAMLATGYARVVTFPPNVAFEREVLVFQDVARDEGKGLWSAC